MTGGISDGGAPIAANAPAVVARLEASSCRYIVGMLPCACSPADSALQPPLPLATALRKGTVAPHREAEHAGIMQRFWYASDARRERFVSICRDRDVQELTWQACMHKKLVRARPLAHLRSFAKDVAHLLGLARV